jgi:hypothetical protein
MELESLSDLLQIYDEIRKRLEIVAIFFSFLSAGHIGIAAILCGFANIASGPNRAQEISSVVGRIYILSYFFKTCGSQLSEN